MISTVPSNKEILSSVISFPLSSTAYQDSLGSISSNGHCFFNTSRKVLSGSARTRCSSPVAECFTTLATLPSCSFVMLVDGRSMFSLPERQQKLRRKRIDEPTKSGIDRVGGRERMPVSPNAPQKYRRIVAKGIRRNRAANILISSFLNC